MTNSPFTVETKSINMKIEIRSCRNFASALAGLTGLLLFTSCATNPPTLSGTVGPKSAAAHSAGGTGYLMVYSDTQEIHLDNVITYHIHTSYNIETPNGQTVQWVPNHTGDMDEAAQLVPLPSGNYQVLAESTDYGQVRVPVVIQSGQTTKVHLEGKGSWNPKKSSAGSTHLVCFPEGEIVGWQALAGK